LSWRRKEVARVAAISLAIVSLVLVFVLSMSAFPTTQNFLNTNQHPVGIAITVAFLIGGLLAWFTKDARNQRRFATDISSVGMAALVDPLLDIGLNLSALRATPRAFTGEWQSAMNESGAPSRLKWRYGDSLRGQALTQWKDPWVQDGLDLEIQSAVAEMSDQAVRRLMVSLRSWADLLSVTSYGQTAMMALADLRLRLFEMSESCRVNSDSESADPCQQDRISREISECALRALLLALIFESCGGASRPRNGFGDVLQHWHLPKWAHPLESWSSPFGKGGDVEATVGSGLSLLEAYGRDLVGTSRRDTSRTVHLYQPAGGRQLNVSPSPRLQTDAEDLHRSRSSSTMDEVMEGDPNPPG